MERLVHAWCNAPRPRGVIALFSCAAIVSSVSRAGCHRAFIVSSLIRFGSASVVTAQPEG